MRALLAWCLALLPLLAAAGDTATVRIIPETLSPGQPFRMEIAIRSTDDFPGPALRISSELPTLDQIPLRFAGQRFTSGNMTTLLVSGVAPETPGEHLIPAFTATLAVRKVAVPATRLVVRPAAPGTVPGFAKFSLELPDRVFYVGETVVARVILGSGASEQVSGAYGVEARGEGLTCRAPGQIARQEDGTLVAELELTPTQAGTLELRVGGMALVDAAGAGASRERPFAFSRKLRAAHVPERDRPADWTGAVGSLVAGPASVSNPKPGIGEPTTLSVTVKGAGNLDRILAPEVPHGDAWDVQPATSVARGARTPGQRTFAYTLIPRLPGNLRTPPVRISCFNPESARFERIEFPPIEVTVTGQAPAKVELVALDPAASPATAGGAAPARATELADPVAGGRAIGSLPLLAQPAKLLWGQLACLVALVAALAWAARRDWLARHPELVRRRVARRILRAARRRMRKAERSRDADAHAGAAVEGLRAGAAPLRAASDGALTAEDVLRAAPELASHEAVRAAFRRADGTRFGGAGAPDTLSRHADLERCLGQLESRLCD